MFGHGPFKIDTLLGPILKRPWGQGRLESGQVVRRPVGDRAILDHRPHSQTRCPTISDGKPVKSHESVPGLVVKLEIDRIGNRQVG